ncbi:MAG: hypothetical protein ACK5LK_08750 [Chthoniobacterales bacterium]
MGCLQRKRQPHLKQTERYKQRGANNVLGNHLNEDSNISFEVNGATLSKIVKQSSDRKFEIPEGHTGRVDFRGLTFKSPYDLAMAAQVYRDPRFETVR